MNYPPVYALMVTNSDKRLDFARFVGIRNFKEQDYNNKFLIIVNHGKTKILNQQTHNIFELMIDRNNLSLGDLRNISLELVPLNSVFTIWDDDDIRKTNYISLLIDQLIKNNATAVFIQNRIEYILSNSYSYVHTFINGTTHVMMWKLDKFRYLDLDTLEDVHIQDYLKQINKKFIIINNKPTLYIRIQHNNNTSPFATGDRTSIVTNNPFSFYKEYSIDDNDKLYVDNIIKNYLLFI
jgi:hypothetical protein